MNKFVFWRKLFVVSRSRKQAESDDDDASVDFDGEDSGSDYDENEKLLLEKTRKELAQGPYDSDEDSEVIDFLSYRWIAENIWNILL